MMGTIKDSRGESELRRQAEEKLKETTSGCEDLSGVSPDKMASLIHELQVHQIELNMQNDELRRIQEELENTRDRYSHLYDFAPVGYFTISENGIIEEANLTGAAMIGIERSALIGKPFTRLVLREDRDILYTHRQRLLETEASQSCELRLVKKDGQAFHARMECTVIKNKDDNSRQIRATISDITEHKMAGKALKESEEKYKTLTENSQTGIYIHQDDKIVYANDRFAELHGYTVPELLNTNYFKLFHPSERERAQQIKSKRLRGEAAPQYHETRRVKKDGRILWCQTVAVCIEYQGRPAIMGNVVDITARKQAEEALRQSEEMHRQLFEAESDAIFLIENETGCILNANSAAAALYGYSREELLLMKNMDLSGEQQETQQVTQGTPLIEDRVVTIPLRMHKKRDGTVFPVEITGRFFSWQGKPVHIAAIRNITQRIALENQLRQSQKMESIGTLAGGIAHDFNNILAIIIGYTELALMDVPEWNPAKGFLKEVQSASYRAKDLVRHILNFSRKAITDRKPLKICPIVEDTLNMLRASIPTNIEIRRNISCDSDMILADPTQIGQVLLNLCTNAAHAMQDESGILEVSLQNVEFRKQQVELDLGPGRYVKLTVSDTGQGIDSKIMDRIFDPYFTTKGLGKGTGLGLSVVQGIVRTHNGAVTVNSEPGKGTVFEVLFPVSEGEMEPEAEGPEAFPGGNEKILVIDDEASILDLVKKRLELQGYQIEAKNDPVDALELFRSNPDRFDLIITDMTMPKMIGDKLTKEILDIRPDMPIILCSGYSDRINAVKSAALGIRKYIEKPLNMSDFLVSIRKVLDEAKG